MKNGFHPRHTYNNLPLWLKTGNISGIHHKLLNGYSHRYFRLEL